MDHRRRGDEIDRWPECYCAGEAMICDVRSVEEKQIVGAVSDARERAVGIIRVEFEPACGPKQRRANRAAKIEIEADGLAPIERLADEPGTRGAAAANDA